MNENPDKIDKPASQEISGKTYEVSSANEGIYSEDSYDETLIGTDSTSQPQKQKTNFCSGMGVIIISIITIALVIVLWDYLFGAIK